MFRYFLLCFLGITTLTFAQTNRITVDANMVMNKIPSTLYGSCMEDVNHEIYGGLYDQRIMGESFEEPSSGINYNYWMKHGGYWAANREYGNESISIVPGRHTKRMVGNNEIGVEPDEHAKLLYTSATITDGVFEADMKFVQTRGEGGGLLVRASNAGIGENALHGYEIRLSRREQKLKLVKHENNFQLLAEAKVLFSPDGWNHILVHFSGPRIQVFINHSALPVIAYTDANPIAEGRVGLATAGAPLNFRKVGLLQHGKTVMLPLTYSSDQLVSDRWDIIQTGSAQAAFSLTQQDAFNGLTAQTIEFVNGDGRVGIGNRSLNRWGIAVQQGQVFNGYCYLRGNLPVTVSLESKDGNITYASQAITTNDTGWKKYVFTLAANATDTNARFALYLTQRGKIFVDQAVLFSTGDKQFKGLPMRADIVNALVAEGLTFMRYAGTMVNADGYRFRKMLGSRDLRPPYTGHWNEYSTNGFGIEEFVQFCEAAGFPGVFAINIEETEQDAGDMIEYLNGDVSTSWGKKRAENGHPDPYGARYIEIGNEEALFEGDDARAYDHYIERFTKLYNAIHAKDSTVLLIASPWWRPDSKHIEKVFKGINGKAAYWDLHVWADDKDAGLSVDKELTRMQNLFKQWDANTTLKCAIFEENGGLHNMQRALGHATTLNAVRRHGEFVFTSVPANALQPYLQNDNGWDQGQIFFTPHQVWGMPPFYAQQMASANHLPLRVQDTVQGILNVTSTRSEDGSALVLHIVNTDTTAQQATIVLNNFLKRKKLVQVFTLSAGLNAENLPGTPEAVATKKTSLNIPAQGDIAYKFEPLSYTILRFER